MAKTKKAAAVHGFRKPLATSAGSNMHLQRGSIAVHRNLLVSLIVLVLTTIIASYDYGLAFSDKEARQIYGMLDPEHRGQVTKTQFEMYKMNAFYFGETPDRLGQMKPLTFEETKLSRAYFDKIDQNHKGYIDGVDFIDSIHFEDIDMRRRGYFDLSDLSAFLSKIGR